MSRLISISSIVFILLWTSIASAIPEGITDIKVTNFNDELRVSASYRGGFTSEIKREIINGISREFFYYIVLYRVMPRWLDEEKTSKTIKYTVKYDMLKNQFLVAKSVGTTKEKQVFDSYDEMVEWVSRIENINLAPLKFLRSHHRYYVSIKAEIKAGELPFLLRYLLFFVPYSKFNTEWAHSRVFMLKELR